MRISVPALTIVISASFPAIADVGNGIFTPGSLSGDIGKVRISPRCEIIVL